MTEDLNFLFFSVMKWRKSRSLKTWMMPKLWELCCPNTKTHTTPKCWWPTSQHMFCILVENICAFWKNIFQRCFTKPRQAASCPSETARHQLECQPFFTSVKSVGSESAEMHWLGCADSQILSCSNFRQDDQISI